MWLNQYFNVILINALLSFVLRLSVDKMRAYRRFTHIVSVGPRMCVCVYVQECLGSAKYNESTVNTYCQSQEDFLKSEKYVALMRR